MFIAELTALDLGAHVRLRAVPKGGKFPVYHRGYLTEIHHNAEDGYVALRVFQGNISGPEGKKAVIKHRQGRTRKFKYGEQVEILEAA